MVGYRALVRDASDIGFPVRQVIGLKAVADIQLLPKLLGIVAQFGFLPALLNVRHEVSFLIVDIEIATDDRKKVGLLAEKLRALVSVERATLVETGYVFEAGRAA